MKKPLNITALILAGLLTVASVIGCSADTQAAAVAAAALPPAVATAAVTLPVSDYDTEDLETAIPSDATLIALKGTTATVDGPGASAAGSTVTLSEAGTYVISGTLSSGQLVVDADKEAMVRIVLNGASVTNPTGPALYGVQAEKIILTLAPDTVNVLTDGSAYSLAEGEDEPNAALFSKEDLSINGTGALTVTGNYAHGIVSKDDLVLADGTLHVTAVENGIRGRDSVSVKAGTITVLAGNDGIQANNDEDAAKGWIILDGGLITLTAGDDGIHAETDLVINDGTLCILDSVEGLEGKAITVSGGVIGLKAQDDGINATSGSTEEATAEGTRPAGPMDSAQEGVYIRILGGSLSVDAAGDGIDSNGDLFLEGGSILVNGPINGGNGALDYNGTCTVSGGTLAIAGSAGMAQSPGEASSQNSLTVVFTAAQAAGTPVTLTDASGRTVLSVTPTKVFQSVVFSSPALKRGAAYTLSTGGTLSAAPVNGIITQGTLSGAQALTTVSLTQTVTRINENGEAAAEGRMGPGGKGTRTQRPGEAGTETP